MAVLHEIIKKNETLPIKIFEFESQNPDRIIPQHWHRSIEIFILRFW